MPLDKHELIKLFQSETKNHLRELRLGIFKLRESHQRDELLKNMIREAHTIKGSSAMMNYLPISNVASEIETELKKALQKKLPLKEDYFTILLKQTDTINSLLEKGLTWKAKEISEKKEGTGKTILLAEDVMNTAIFEKDILESEGYAVVIARDGQDALEKSAQEKFDLIITDIIMPRMDGLELASHLRKNKLYQDTPIIAVTTLASETDKKRGQEAGINTYLLKSDFNQANFLTAVRELLN